jgi:plastocyanin
MSATTLFTVSRLLGSWERQHIVAVGRQRIHILKRRALASPAIAPRKRQMNPISCSRTLRATGSVIGGIAVLATIATSCQQSDRSGGSDTPALGPAAHGTITGRVRLIGTPPENDAIHMRADPMCDKANGGKRVIEEAVVEGADGALANVLVQLRGEYPNAPARTQPVTIDQRGCVYLPRVVGLQIGEPLQVGNSDPGLHNVHAVSSGSDGFNVGQPVAGIVNTFRLTTPGVTRLQCDVHSWMVAFVGVVPHPYFAVTNTEGRFELHDVPSGTHDIQFWHEHYGTGTSTVYVKPEGTAEVDFTYGESPDPK